MNETEKNALTDRGVALKDAILALVEASEFEIDVDRWGTNKIVLRHFKPNGKYDIEIEVG